MIEIVQNFLELKNQMGALINKSGYKNSFIAEKIGMQATLFSVKKQRGNWTESEMEKILAIIENEELEDYYLGQVMQLVEKENEYMSYEDLKAEMGWK
jgi:DNA anti-recombination protein RmuC